MTKLGLSTNLPTQRAIADFAGSTPQLLRDQISSAPTNVALASGTTLQADSWESIVVLSAPLSIGPSANGIVFEKGASAVGMCLYFRAADDTLRFCCGTGNTTNPVIHDTPPGLNSAGSVRGTPTLLVPTPLGDRDIEILAIDLGPGTVAVSIYIDGLRQQTSLIDRGSLDFLFAGSDDGGTLTTHNNICATRFGASTPDGTGFTFRDDVSIWASTIQLGNPLSITPGLEASFESGLINGGSPVGVY